MQNKAYLLLSDGVYMEGLSIGKKGTASGEICFNTGMTGYQEIYTDPSYYGQIVINTLAHIGNYGTIPEEAESRNIKIKGVITKHFSSIYSRSNSNTSLQEYLKNNDTVGISEVDTRKLVRHIQKKGVMNAVISSEISHIPTLENILSKISSMRGAELASKVSTQKPYTMGNSNSPYKIAVLDLGIKRSILRNFTQKSCFCKIFPARTSYSEMAKWKPDGYFISNGPGDPSAMDYAINTTQLILKNEIPLFGICLGHQLLALSQSVNTFKMKHGHRGLNHPVKNLKTGYCEVTSQNHGFGINLEETKIHPRIAITHINLNDHSIEGIRLKYKKAFSVQYHPESVPGPHDSKYLFDSFLDMIRNQ